MNRYSLWLFVLGVCAVGLFFYLGNLVFNRLPPLAPTTSEPSDPLVTHCCHCLNCQRQTGSAFVINLLIEADRVELLAGTPQPVEVPRDDGSKQLIFRCPACQVAIFSEYGRPEVRFVRGGTLDQPSGVTQVPLAGGRAGVVLVRVRSWHPTRPRTQCRPTRTPGTRRALGRLHTRASRVS